MNSSQRQCHPVPISSASSASLMGLLYAGRRLEMERTTPMPPNVQVSTQERRTALTAILGAAIDIACESEGEEELQAAQ